MIGLVANATAKGLGGHRRAFTALNACEKVPITPLACSTVSVANCDALIKSEKSTMPAKIVL
jgi:hypothetical protein